MPEISTQDIHEQHTLEFNSSDSLSAKAESVASRRKLGLFELDPETLDPTQKKSEFIVNENSSVQGGIGEIFQAEDLKLGRSVLVKRLSSGINKQDLLHEGRRQAKAGGRASAIIYDVQADETGNYYLIMEDLLENYDLLYNCRGEMSLADFTSLVIGLTDAIGQIHKKGLLHRDIKPKNAFFTRGRQEPKVKVIDFGAAIEISKLADEDLLIVGTIDYMAPELIREVPQYSEQSDIYAIGMTLYDVFVGKTAIQVALDKDRDRSPYRDEGAKKRAYIIKNEEVIFPQEFYNTCDAWGIDEESVKQVFKTLLHKDRNKRYQSVEEVRIGLLNALKEPQLEKKVVHYGFSKPPRSSNDETRFLSSDDL